LGPFIGSFSPSTFTTSDARHIGFPSVSFPGPSQSAVGAMVILRHPRPPPLVHSTSHSLLSPFSKTHSLVHLQGGCPSIHPEHLGPSNRSRGRLMQPSIPHTTHPREVVGSVLSSTRSLKLLGCQPNFVGISTVGSLSFVIGMASASSCRRAYPSFPTCSSRLMQRVHRLWSYVAFPLVFRFLVVPVLPTFHRVYGASAYRCSCTSLGGELVKTTGPIPMRQP
jgi:hypothetical protein